ncbi:hypothetical protein V501_05328 [Pseudogymnoascus sp. VKM F-4519 (FW-2642)]|nr:hypothetical protein V501_05328 [Pseudogymnoascus sp. VKM F-4519 (FW-2642)]
MQLLLPVLYMAAIAAAQPTQQCEGAMECCNSLEDSNSPAIIQLASLLGIAIPDGQVGQAGLTCNPMRASSNTCDRQQACCTGSSMNGGLLVLGCTPVNKKHTTY